MNGDRTAQQQVQLDALTADVTAAQAQVTNAQTQQEQDDLTTQELRTAATQGLQIVDPPQVPLAPDSIKKKEALTLGVFVVLGLIVAGSLLLISTLLDRTVRSAEDIDAASGLAVIATVPYVSALRPSRKTRRQQTGRKRAAAAAA